MKILLLSFAEKGFIIHSATCPESHTAVRTQGWASTQEPVFFIKQIRSLHFWLKTSQSLPSAYEIESKCLHVTDKAGPCLPFHLTCFRHMGCFSVPQTFLPQGFHLCSAIWLKCFSSRVLLGWPHFIIQDSVQMPLLQTGFHWQVYRRTASMVTLQQFSFLHDTYHYLKSSFFFFFFV